MNPLTAILGIGEKILDRVLPNPEAKAAALLELQKLEQEGKLAEMANEFADIKSAREREAQIATSEHSSWLSKNITPILALTIFFMNFVLYGYLVISNEPIAPEKKDIILYISGTLNALSMAVVGYFFGSTVGSAKRVDGIMDMVKKK